MQDALFQSRVATGNLLKLQKELDNFLELDYLKELKILPTDEDTAEEDNSITDKSDIKNNRETILVDDSNISSSSSMLDSESILSAALTRAAHII
jgi:hypothetical protein